MLLMTTDIMFSTVKELVFSTANRIYPAHYSFLAVHSVQCGDRFKGPPALNYTETETGNGCHLERTVLVCTYE